MAKSSRPLEQLGRFANSSGKPLSATTACRRSLLCRRVCNSQQPAVVCKLCCGSSLSCDQAANNSGKPCKRPQLRSLQTRLRTSAAPCATSCRTSANNSQAAATALQQSCEFFGEAFACSGSLPLVQTCLMAMQNCLLEDMAIPSRLSLPKLHG